MHEYAIELTENKLDVALGVPQYSLKPKEWRQKLAVCSATISGANVERP